MRRYYIENRQTPMSEIFILKRKETAESNPDLCLAVEVSPDNMSAFTCPEFVDLYPQWDFKANGEQPEYTFEITPVEFNIYATMFNNALKYEQESKKDSEQISSAFVNELKRVTANAIQLFYLMASTISETNRKFKFGKCARTKR